MRGKCSTNTEYRIEKEIFYRFEEKNHTLMLHLIVVNIKENNNNIYWMKDKGEEVHAVRERDILKLLYKNREKETKSNRKMK